MSSNPKCYDCNEVTQVSGFHALKFFVCPSCKYEVDNTGMPVKPSNVNKKPIPTATVNTSEKEPELSSTCSCNGRGLCLGCIGFYDTLSTESTPCQHGVPTSEKCPYCAWSQKTQTTAPSWAFNYIKPGPPR